ncbi:MAG TPA: aminomethyl-transferring glycine dehydrogenase subunit GcvPA [Candidatus Acidoferrales bacterium]|nr:aminomethyl-transferring glycine dehydrogenase subunit GcvPA [Candidatus Acidoferrales bacterium]
MSYLPKSDADRQAMLRAIGAESIDELFRSIPAEFRLRVPLKIPGPMAEAEIIGYFRDRAAENSVGYASFLGAGVYRHLRSVVADALLQRGEFLTAYTPYQAEISQGTLQWIFEFQTLICQLTGQEVANASMYDGSTALAEAVLMAERITGRRRVVTARTLHPEYRDVLETYAQHAGLEIESAGYGTSGQADLDALGSAVNDRTAAVVVQSPNFFGAIEQIPAVAEIAHAAGALLVVAITEAVSLGLLRPPAEADIVAMEGQSFGLPPSYGGPFAGVLATREKFVRQMPGRLAGQTTDAAGHRGFCLTLATREQHIRREKATSNICTNQALCALAMTMHLCLLGREGVREVAAQNLAKARYAARALAAVPGVKRAFTAPTFNEFVVRLAVPVDRVNGELLEDKIIGPLALAPFYGELDDCALVCVTETTTRAEIDRLAEGLRHILAREPATAGRAVKRTTGGD